MIFVSKDVSIFAFQVTTYKPQLHTLCWRFTMSTMQRPGACIALRKPRPVKSHRTTGRPGSAGNGPSAAFMGTTCPGMLDRFCEQFRLTGTETSLEEVLELRTFDEFLARHVQPNGIYDVQCMLLWSEWVRSFRHLTSGFPKLIGEKEFSSVITDKFGLEIASNGFRGEVYPGIRFVP